jgi:hypothetical protein
MDKLMSISHHKKIVIFRLKPPDSSMLIQDHTLKKESNSSNSASVSANRNNAVRAG